VASHPKRYYGNDHLHFITCSCYHRQHWLASRRRRDLLLKVLEQVRQRRVAGQRTLFSEVSEHVWQRRFYDFNVWSDRKRIEKLRYMHRNPVKRTLVAEPEQWAWSSYRSYKLGEPGMVRINQWGAAQMKVRDKAA
jgi:putative transposase